jgi:hypothetical protein
MKSSSSIYMITVSGFTPYRSLTNCEMQGIPIKVTLRVRYSSDERLDFWLC